MRTIKINLSQLADVLKPTGMTKARGNGKYELQVSEASDGAEGLLTFKHGLFGGLVFDCPDWGVRFPSFHGLIVPMFKIVVDGKVVGVELLFASSNACVTLNEHVDALVDLFKRRFPVFGQDLNEYPLIKDDGKIYIRKIAFPYFYSAAGNVLANNLGRRLVYDVIHVLNEVAASNKLRPGVKKIDWTCDKRGELKGEAGGWDYQLKSDATIEEVTISRELYEKFLIDKDLG